MEPYRESRKRLRPWLEKMINNGDCPGLIWDNREERTFRIPWRHFNNRDWASKDSLVFKEWAKYTGKYKEGDDTEYPVWKTRLRCALKKIPEIKELPNQHNLEDANPYRVYQFVDPPALRRVDINFEGGAVSPACSTVLSNSPYGRDFLEESSTSPPPNFLEDTHQNQLRNVPTVVYDNVFTPQTFNNLTEDRKQKFFNNQPIQHSQVPMATGLELENLPFNITAHFLGHQPQSSSMNITQHQMDGSADKLEAASSEVEGMNISLPSDLRSLDSGDLYIPSDFADYNLECNLMSSSGPSMRVTVFYKSSHGEVLTEKVNEKGCRLFYGETQINLPHAINEEKMFGPKNVKQMKMLPVAKCSQISDQDRIYMLELLNGMERGLVLTMRDGDIYAQRLCRTRVFVSDGVSQSRLLDRKDDVPVKVFDFNGAFKNSLQKNQNGIKEIPKPFFILTFGQEIKSTNLHPLNHLLMYVQVHHMVAEQLVLQLQHSSTSSSLPLISSINSHDQLLDGLKRLAINGQDTVAS